MNGLALREGRKISSDEGAQVLDLGAARRRREHRDEPWVKVDRLAEEIDYSARQIYRFVRAGAPVRQLRGGTLRFQVGPFKEWLEQRSD